MVLKGGQLPGSQLLAVDVRVEAIETVIALRGELDIAGTSRFAAVTDDVKAPGSRVAVDLSQLTFSDGAGVRIMHRARSWMRDHDGELTLCHVQPPVRRVLELCGVADMAPFDDPRAAVRAIQITHDGAEPLASPGAPARSLSREPSGTPKTSATTSKGAA